MGSWKLWPRRLRKLARLPAARRRRLLAALGLLWLVRVGLWTVPFRRLSARLRRMETNNCDGAAGAAADELVWCIEAASRFVPAASCLTRSMAAQVLLRRNGHPSTLRIGVARGARGVLEAHAWVECEGRVVVGETENLDRFTALPLSDEASKTSPASRAY